MPGKRLNSQAQAMILSLLEYFEAEKTNGGPLLPLTAVRERVANALKISESSVTAIKQRIKSNPILSSPGKSRPRRKSKSTDLHDGVKMAIRDTIYDMYQQKKHVTLATLNTELRAKQITHISRTSLHRVLPSIGFKFAKESNRRFLVERTNIAAMRGYFMREYVKNLQSPIRDIIFLDETWIYSKGNPMKSWQDSNVKSVRKPEGYDGKRYIILHAGGTGGFVNNAGLIFASKTISADYHTEMNGDLFFKWVKEQLVCNLEGPSLIIIDNAPYHSMLLEKQPTSTWRKAEIIQWLNNNNVSIENNMNKNELLALAKLNQKPKRYVIDEYMREQGHEVLRLPPYHCDFNAIELVWAQAKTYYNKHIGRDGYGDTQVLAMWKEALEHIGPDVWENCVRHTSTLITKWYQSEELIEEAIEAVKPLVIHVSASDTDSDISSESDT